jgi:RNA polymerase sigma-70 factor, ECF subfamily
MMAQEMAYPFCVVNAPSIGRAENRQGIGMASDTTRLTQAIVGGDEAAFGEFYDRYRGRLYGFLLVLTSGQEDVAREVHQIVMVKVARKFKVIATETELWLWLAQVARNAFVDHVRKHARRRECALDGAAADRQETLPADPEENLIQQLEEGLQCLDGEERSLVEAVYFDKRAHKDVAIESGLTVKAIDSKLGRIRAKLRTFIMRSMGNER